MTEETRVHDLELENRGLRTLLSEMSSEISDMAAAHAAWTARLRERFAVGTIAAPGADKFRLTDIVSALEKTLRAKSEDGRSADDGLDEWNAKLLIGRVICALQDLRQT